MAVELLRAYSTWVLIALLAGLAISVVAFLVAYRHARRAALFLWRKEAAARCRRLLGVIFILCLAIGGVFWLTLFGPSPTPLVSASPSVTPALTPPVATRVAIGYPSATPTPTAPPATPTVAPTATPSLVRAATVVAVPTATRPRLHDVILARGVSPAREPIGPASEFEPTTEPIYAFFAYSNMRHGMAWSYAWLKEDVEMIRENATWTWGWAGRAYIFFTPLGGYQPGQYSVRLYLEDQLQVEARFEIH